jgi:hypothetical protein
MGNFYRSVEGANNLTPVNLLPAAVWLSANGEFGICNHLFTSLLPATIFFENFFEFHDEPLAESQTAATT